MAELKNFEYKENIGYSLEVNAPFYNFEHIKLYVRLPIDMQLKSRYTNILLTHKCNGINYFCTALATYSSYTRDGTIDLTQDISLMLKVKPGDIIGLKYIDVNATCTQLLIEAKNPSEHKIDLICAYLLQKPVIEGMCIYDKKQKLKIKRIKYVSKNKQDVDVAIVTRSTQIIIVEPASNTSVNFNEIGGLDKEIEYLRDVLELPLKHKSLFDKMNLKPPKGIILYGPSGTGKTMLAKAIANMINASFFSINAPAIATKYYGESESKLRDIFEKANKSAPSILFIDELDVIASKRENGTEVDRRICTQLLVLLDGINTNNQVMVIAATNLIKNLDDAIRRGGRFDTEIEIKLPNMSARKDILLKLLKSTRADSKIDIDHISKITNGYSGADLAALVRQAGLSSIKQHVKDPTKSLIIDENNLKHCMKLIKPAILKERDVEKSNITLADVVGLEDVVAEIMGHLELSQKYKTQFQKYKIKPTTGILLYGMPGTGKTMLAKAIGNELSYNVVYLKGPQLLSKYVGETEKEIRRIFEKAKLSYPTVLILDEIDGITSSRNSGEGSEHNNSNSILSQLLTEISELEEYNGEVVIIGTTNRPDLIDPALLRTGRFDLKFEIGLPNKKAIMTLIKRNCDKFEISLTDEQSELFADSILQNKLSCVHINAVFRDAMIHVFQDYDKKIINKIKGPNYNYLKTALDILINRNAVVYQNMKNLAIYY